MTQVTTKRRKVATWLFPHGSDGYLREPNLFSTMVLINFADWTLEEGESRPIEIHIHERDTVAEGGSDDLLGIFKGTISRATQEVEGKQVSYVAWSQTGDYEDQAEAARAAGKTVVTKSAFKIGIHDPTRKPKDKIKAAGISVYGNEGEKEGKTFEITFRIKDGDDEWKLGEDNALLFFVKGGECLLDIPVFAQGDRSGGGKDHRNTLKIVKKHKEKHFPQLKKKSHWKDGIKTDTKEGVVGETVSLRLPYSFSNDDFYKDWDDCKRKIPFLDTENALKADADSLKEISLSDAIKAHGIKKKDSDTENSWPNVGSNLILLNPMKDSKIAETIDYGGCKLTSFSLALFHFGLLKSKVYEQLVNGLKSQGYDGDADKTFFPHTCGAKKVNKRKQCIQKVSKTGDVCNGCTHRDLVDAQVNPFWFNAYVWWWIISIEGGHSFSGSKDKFTDAKGNFSINRKLLEDYLDCEVFAVRVKISSKADKEGGDKPNHSYETAGRKIREYLNRGIPVIAWVQSDNHVNLIRGCKQHTNGTWLYEFLDSGQGGFYSQATIKRFTRYTAFAPKNWKPEPLHFRTGSLGIEGHGDGPPSGTDTTTIDDLETLTSENAIRIRVLDQEGLHIPGLRYQVIAPEGGEPILGRLDADGWLAEEVGPDTEWHLTFPTLIEDYDGWHAENTDDIRWVSENDHGVFTVRSGQTRDLRLDDPR